MALYQVYAKGVLVGHSALEYGDPPMGVAFGQLIPNAAYSEIRSECISNHLDQSALQLSVRTESGLEISCAGVAILDSTADGASPEVNLLGVPYPLYGELFPDQVSSYEKRFSQT